MDETCQAWRSKSTILPLLYSGQAVLIRFAFSASILSRRKGELPAVSLRKMGRPRFRTPTANDLGSGMRNSKIRDDDLQKCCQRGLDQHQLNFSFAIHSTSSPAFSVSLYHLRLAMLSSSRSINWADGSSSCAASKVSGEGFHIRTLCIFHLLASCRAILSMEAVARTSSLLDLFWIAVCPMWATGSSLFELISPSMTIRRM